MTPALRVLQAGPAVTIQDAGRWGYLRFGVTAAGPMDPLAHEAANLAVGAEPTAAAIEVSVGGMDLVAEQAPVVLGILATGFRVSRDGQALPECCVATLGPGERLSVRAGPRGAWAYVAFGGRLEKSPELGSLSMHTRTGLGGRGLAGGDLLHIGAHGAAAPRPLTAVRDPDAGPVRIVPGPQDDFFGAADMSAFLAGPWRVATRSDRMAYALEGPRIGHAKGFNIVSDGIAFGAIQIPGDGAPYIQMADRAPTGGYPKIGTVIGADLGRLAQMRPGDALSFAVVSVAEAVESWRRARARMLAAVSGEPCSASLSSEFLLGANLVSGVVSAH